VSFFHSATAILPPLKKKRPERGCTDAKLKRGGLAVFLIHRPVLRASAGRPTTGGGRAMAGPPIGPAKIGGRAFDQRKGGEKMAPKKGKIKGRGPKVK